MKKITLLLLIFVLTFTTSCDPEDTVPSTTYKLVKIEKFNSSDISESTIAIQYNNGFINKMIRTYNTGVNTINYIYSNGKMTSIEYNNGNSSSLIYTGELITSSLSIDSNGVETGYSTTYTYNSNKQVISKLESGGTVNTATTYAYDNNDNVISSGGIYTYTYDSKKNPYQLVFPLEMQRIESIGQNNRTSESSSRTFSYEYNAKDYPTKMSEYYNGNLVSYTIYTYEEI